MKKLRPPPPTANRLQRGLPLSDPQVARFYQRQIGLLRPAVPETVPPELQALRDEVAKLRNELADTVSACDNRVRSMALETAKARSASIAQLRQTLSERDLTIETLRRDLQRRNDDLDDLEAIVRQLQAVLRRKETQLNGMMDEMRGLLRIALNPPSGDDGAAGSQRP